LASKSPAGVAALIDACQIGAGLRLHGDVRRKPIYAATQGLGGPANDVASGLSGAPDGAGRRLTHATGDIGSALGSAPSAFDGDFARAPQAFANRTLSCRFMDCGDAERDARSSGK
jgi:hypothetical protein